MELRQILNRLKKTKEGKEKTFDVLKRRRNKLGDFNFWLLEYLYCEKLTRSNVRNKLILSKSDYHIKLNIALERLDALIDDTTFREMTKLAKV